MASLLSAELPRGVQARFKTEVTAIDDSLEHAHKLIRTVKTELVEKGHSLNKGKS